MKDVVQPNVAQLLQELDSAQAEFQAAANIVSEAAIFLGKHKSRLNEQQFIARLEAACNDPARAQGLVAKQDNLRVSYFSGRLALECSSSRLRRGLRAYDKLVRTIMKMVATIPAMTDVRARNLLTSKCVEVARAADTTHNATRELAEKNRHQDLTGGLAQKSLTKLYEGICEFGSRQAALTWRFGEEEFPLMFITLSGNDFRGFSLAEGEKENDALVDAANQALERISGDAYNHAWDFYLRTKRALNEPQYAGRLQEASCNNSPETVAALKDQQKQKRLEYFAARITFGTLVDGLFDLQVRINWHSRSLMEHLAINERVGEKHKHVAMNNVVAAAVLSVAITAIVEEWSSECANTDEARQVGEAAMIEDLAEIVGKQPYRSLRWTYYRDGHYVEPL